VRETDACVVVCVVQTDKNDKVWTIVHAEFDEACSNGTLSAGNKRSCKALATKFSTMQGLFRQHVLKLDRMRQSGVSNDDLDNCLDFKDCTTDIWFEHHQQMRPMSVPPHSINGGNAAQGGVASSFLSAGKEARGSDMSSDDEVHDMTSPPASPNAKSVKSPPATPKGKSPKKTLKVKSPLKAANAKASKASLVIGGSSTIKYRPAKKARAGGGADSSSPQAEMEGERQLFRERMNMELAREEREEMRALAREERERRHEREMADRQAERETVQQQFMMTMVASMAKRD